MKNKFKGELERIEPLKLISPLKNKKIGAFILGLGVIFNDLKGLLLFDIMLSNNYEKPKDEVSVHFGNYRGVKAQIEKLFAGIISEFFIFIQKNEEILKETELEKVFHSLSKADRILWEGVIAAANGENYDFNDFLKIIIKIRSNLAYHYDHSGKILMRGYESVFIKKGKNRFNEFAFYSIDDNVEKTRFYFADAAQEGAMLMEIYKEDASFLKDGKDFLDYTDKIVDTIKTMSVLIANFMKKYIQFIRNDP